MLLDFQAEENSNFMMLQSESKEQFLVKECWGCSEMINNVLALEAYLFLTAITNLHIAKIPVLLCCIGHCGVPKLFILLIRSVKMMA